MTPVKVLRLQQPPDWREIRIGIASWDKGDRSAWSIKFAWPDTRGRVSRGGEIPIDALPEMFAFAVREGFIDAAKIQLVRNALAAVKRSR